MDKILDMMRTWSPIGQGLFLLIVLGMFLSLIGQGVRYATILVRGWPPCECPCHEEAEDNET